MTSTEKGVTPAKRGSKKADEANTAESADQQSEPVQKPAKPKRSKKAGEPEAATSTDQAPAPEQTPEPTPGEEPLPESGETKGPTFADMARGYLAELEEAGCSESTVAGYRRELKLAASVLGEEKVLAEITP